MLRPTLAIAIFFFAMSASTQEQTDTIKTQELKEVVVEATMQRIEYIHVNIIGNI